MQRIRLVSMLADTGSLALSGLTGLDWMATGNGDPWLVGLSSVTGMLSRFDLGDPDGLRLLGTQATQHYTNARDMVCVDRAGTETLFAINLLGMQPTERSATGQGTVSAATTLSLPGSAWSLDGLAAFSAGGTYLAGFLRDGDGFALYALRNAQAPQLVARVADQPKIALAGVTDMLAVEVGSARYAIASSALDSGLTSFRLAANGSLTQVDSIAARDGLWVAGYQDMISLSAGGNTYVIGASPGSGSLSVVRINPMGVFFVEDILNDTLQTRFGGARALDAVEVSGRQLIVAGGNDGGVAVLELLPDGTLWHHQSLAQDGLWALGPVASLAAEVIGGTLEIAVAGTARPGLAHLSLPLAELSPPRLGTAGAGNDTLTGSLGDDLLFDGVGRDRMTGGAGADVFVLTGDGERDEITDFEPGIDRIDLGGWGRIYTAAALEISGTSTGSVIRWQTEELVVRSVDGTRLDFEDWAPDAFLF
jgi:serralysin